jgi:flavin-binding protein dodecin
MNMLIDEEGAPTPRQLIGQLLGSATHAEIAVSHVRLGAIDLGAAETQNVQHCRVLLDRLDAGSLASLDWNAAAATAAGTASAAAAGAASAAAIDDAVRRAAQSATALLRFITSDRVELRSAGVSTWRPDFSIYRGLSASPPAPRAVCLVGAHYFGLPPALPAFTCVCDDAAAVALALRRFEQLWERSHDVGDAVVAAVTRLASAVEAAR